MSGSVQEMSAGSSGRAARRAGCLAWLLVLGLGASIWSANPAVADTPAPIPTPSLPQASQEPTSETTSTAEPTQEPGETTPDPTTAPATTPAAPAPGPTPERSSAAPRQDQGGQVLDAEPPAVALTGRDPISWIIAAAVLLTGTVLVVLLARRPDPVRLQPAHATSVRDSANEDTEGAAARLASLEAVGEAMLDAGYSVTGVRSALVDIAEVNGYPDTEVVVFPTALFVSARGLGEVRTGAVSSGHSELMLNQIDALDDVVKAARAEPSDPASVTAGVAAVRILPPPYSRSQRILAHALLSGSISVLLGASWAGVGVAAALGLLVGAILLRTEHTWFRYQALITVALAFVVSVVVFSLTRFGLDPGVLAALIAPLVTLLPGGLLTTGVIELATGQMMAGAGRLAAGVMRLVLLGAGIVAGASLVGVPMLEFDQAQNPIGPLGPWLAVAVFGVAIVIAQCGRPRSMPWVLLVLYVAYGAQVIGDIFFGGVLSAMIGALAMTPVAYLVSTQRSGPAAFASFLPAFWMLVPGSLGLVGVASILDGDSAGLNTLVATASTMVSITLGILAGSVLGTRVAGRSTVVAV